MPSDPSSAFKVIIAGGGPVGLITAHCLSKAGIDYEILEKRADNALNTGTSSALWPQALRVLDQLGLLDAVRKIQYLTEHKVNLLGDGMVLSENDFYLEVGKAHGHRPMLLHRQELVDMLQDHLPGGDQHLHFNKKVTSITTTPESEHPPPGQEVTVTCSDGTSYTGSMVVGADGVYSTVRRIMNSKLGLPETGPKSNTEPMNVTYLGLFGSCSPLTMPTCMPPRSDAHSKSTPSSSTSASNDDNSDTSSEPTLLPSLTFYETHGPNHALQLALHNKRSFFAIYHRIPTQPSSGSVLPRRHKEAYTDKDQESLAKQYAKIHATPWHTFSDVWNQKLWTYMAPLEEGVASTWYSATDRIVLLGDAVHKHTPISGMGFTSGVTSAAVLVNLLHKALQLHNPHTKTDGNKKSPLLPTTQELGAVFSQFQTKRKPTATKEVEFTRMHTRIASWENTLLRIADRYILSKINGDLLILKYVLSPMIRDGEVLDFVEEKDFREGTVKWRVPRVHPLRDRGGITS